jgi:dipeptidyl aminopeptidase/acylaminoacyl peptidase
MMVTELAKRLCGAVGLLTALACQAAVAAPPLVEDFTRPANIEDVVLSPSGQHMAVLMRGSAARPQLVIMSLPPDGSGKAIAGFSDANITRVSWVNDDRLVFETFEDGAEIAEGGAGTYAINRDGSEMRQLIAWRGANFETGTSIHSRVLIYGWFLHSTLDDGSADVVVYRNVRDGRGEIKERPLARLNTRTGELRSLTAGMPAHSWQWLLDPKGEASVVVADRDGHDKIYWRDPAREGWTLLEDFDALASSDAFVPRYLDVDGRLLALARIGRDESALYAYDLKARKLNPEPLVALAGFDLNPTFEFDSRARRVLGLHFRADRPMTYWFNDKLDAFQRSIDAGLPKGRVNRLICGRCETTQFIVVHSQSDRQPGEYFVADRAKGTVVPVGKSRPWIDEAQQGRRTFHRIQTRDGLPMPVYITHPVGESATDALPAVLLVHGGPNVRGADTLWDAEAQFLASRGYRVIEPEFRGSTGYGWRHFRAGWKEWGLAMQDDLIDALRWAEKERLVDASRVCIMGASYGGYAALMGAIRHPGTYRCAISFAGVTDIDLMYSIHWSDISEHAKRYSMPQLIGDAETDAAKLRNASPLRRAGEIKIPVLLAHGSLDRRVPEDHARAFVKAARAGGVAIEEVNYVDEGHGWFLPKNHTDFFARVEKFLARALAKPE